MRTEPKTGHQQSSMLTTEPRRTQLSRQIIFEGLLRLEHILSTHFCDVHLKIKNKIHSVSLDSSLNFVMKISLFKSILKNVLT
jgi:hypothetical protein